MPKIEKEILEKQEDTQATKRPKAELGKLAQLLERNGIDVADIAKVNKVNAWQGFYKDKDGEAHQVDMMGIQLTPHWADGPEWPVVVPSPPVTIKGPKPGKPVEGDWKTAAIVPDVQIGYYRTRDDVLHPIHDEAALDVAMQVIKAAKPDLVVAVGDNIDLGEMSRFRLSVAFQRTTQATIDRAATFAAELRAAAPHAEIIWLAGNHECARYDTRTLTDQGFKEYHELKVGDRVMTVNDAGETIYENIEAVHVYPFDGEMVTLKSQKVDFSVTPNHRIVGLTSSGKSWIEKTAGELLSQPKDTRLVVSGVNPQPDCDLSDDQIRLMAWCLTDSYMGGPHKDYWRFTQREGNYRRIADLLDRVGIPYTTSFRRDRNITEIDGKPVASHEDEVVLNIPAKAGREQIVWDHQELPDIVWKFSARQTRLFIEEYQECDGTQATHGVDCYVLYISRTKLREDIQRLCIANGIAASATEYRPNHWRLNLDKRTTSRICSGKEAPVPQTEAYTGIVWCLTVPSGRFFIEHNGRVHLTGNSRLPNYIVDNAKAAFGLRKGNAPESWPVMSVPELCRLDEHDVKFVPGYPASIWWINERLKVIHGDKVASGSTAHKYLASERVSVCYGHIHRREYAAITRESFSGPRTIMAFSPGCLCRIDGKVPSTKQGEDLDGIPLSRPENWQQGLGIISYEPGDGRFVPEMIPIHDGWALWRGKEFNASVDVEGNPL